MCMDQGPFLLIKKGEEVSLEHVSSIIPAAGELKLVDVFGKIQKIPGSISEIDLLNKRIVLD